MLNWLVVAIVIGVLPAAIAHQKGQNFALWWLYGAALFIVALPHAILLKADARVLDRRALDSGMKQCPECAELVKREAKKCRFCGYQFGELAEQDDLDIARYASGGSLRPAEALTASGFLPAAIGIIVLVVGIVLATVFMGSK